ncbi:S-layer homology domain-containing protein [Cohnella xylanilytica]|uniref:S-layer homology domain-containing protein n=1 Tax=Cohnella xylanilytica TaxID=557555 RepID=UPI001BB3DB04|nr:S-layer homology domain-containing protein [Cohnella xylanilytica]
MKRRGYGFRWRQVALALLAVLLGVTGGMPFAPGGWIGRASADANNYYISTAAGSGTLGYGGDGGPATSAKLAAPYGVAVDGGGNIYIADRNNSVLRVVDPSGRISSVSVPGMYWPQGIAFDDSGNLYIANSGGLNILKRTPSGTVTVVAGTGAARSSGDGGPATSAELNYPSQVAVDADGNLYISESVSSVIRRVDAATGIIDTVAGTGTYGYSGPGGPATSVQLWNPYGMAFDSDGNLYIADMGNNVIRKLDVATEVISTVAGTAAGGYSGDGGPATSARLSAPLDVAFDDNGNMYISEADHVRKVDASGTIRTVAGTTRGYSGDGGEATAAQLSGPGFMTFDGNGNLFVSDPFNSVVRKLVPFYKVTFQSNGGTPVSPQNLDPGDAATEPGDPARTGHTFGGWFADEALTVPFDFATPINGDTTLYAGWTPIPYTVTFDKNGGDTEANPTSMTVNYGSAAGALPTAPTRDGYTFAGWAAAPDGSGPVFLASTVVTGDLTVYARWIANPLAQPANLKAVPGDRQAKLTWDGVAGATSYRIYMRTESGAYGDTPPIEVAGTSHTVTGLTNGTTYFFVVTARSAARDGLPSAEASATPSGTVVLPTLTEVRLASDNPAAGWAKPGDKATLAFASNTALGSLPTVTIAGRPAAVTATGGNGYSASYTFDGSETEGAVPFAIDFEDGAGTPGAQVTATTDGSGVNFDKTAPTGTMTINGGAAATSSAAVSLQLTSSDGAGSGGVRMRFSNDGLTWSDWEAASAARKWTLSSGNGAKTVSMELIDRAGNASPTAIAATIALRRASSPTETPDRTIQVQIADGKGGSVVETAVVQRTIDVDGLYKDKVTFTDYPWTQALDKLKALGSDFAKVVFPDDNGLTKEWSLVFPKTVTDLLSGSGTNMEIVTNDARVYLPAASLRGLTEDLSFRIAPVQQEDERKATERRALTDPLTLEATKGGSVEALGRPIVIESNLSGAEAQLILPLEETRKLDKSREKPAAFVEHGDGTKELADGKIEDFDQGGRPGVRVAVDRFSTFTILKIGQAPEHKAYVLGNPDGTFGPERPITRAEMAALLTRAVVREESYAPRSYTDVAEGYWARDAIVQAAKTGLMSGYGDGSFKPDAPITRAEMASAISRLLTDEPSAAVFPDAAGIWAETSIRKTSAAGIVKGYEDGTFRPNGNLTRAEAVAMLDRLLGRGSLAGAPRKWTDVPATYWAYGYIQEASFDHRYEIKEEGGEAYVSAP